MSTWVRLLFQLHVPIATARGSRNALMPEVKDIHHHGYHHGYHHGLEHF